MTVTAKPTGPPEADGVVIEQSWAEPERFAVIGHPWPSPRSDMRQRSHI